MHKLPFFLSFFLFESVCILGLSIGQGGGVAMSLRRCEWRVWFCRQTTSKPFVHRSPSYSLWNCLGNPNFFSDRWNFSRWRINVCKVKGLIVHMVTWEHLCEILKVPRGFLVFPMEFPSTWKFYGGRKWKGRRPLGQLFSGAGGGFNFNDRIRSLLLRCYMIDIYIAWDNALLQSHNERLAHVYILVLRGHPPSPAPKSKFMNTKKFFHKEKYTYICTDHP